jgi:hypothetical protein
VKHCAWRSEMPSGVQGRTVWVGLRVAVVKVG